MVEAPEEAAPTIAETSEESAEEAVEVASPPKRGGRRGAKKASPVKRGGRRGAKALEETAEVTEVETPAAVVTSTKRGAKSKANEVAADETITKPAARGRRGAKAVAEPAVEP